MDRPAELIEGEVTGLPFPARSEIVHGRRHPARRDDARRPVRRMARLLRGRGEGRAGDPHQAHLSPQRSDPHVRGEPEAAALASFRALFPALGGAARCARRRRHPGREGRVAAPGRRRAARSAWCRSSSATSAIRRRSASSPRRSRRSATSAAGSSWWTTTSIRPTSRTSSGRWARAAIPKTRTTVLDHCWSSRLDTLVTDYSRLYNSRMVIDACRPYERSRFPEGRQTSHGARRRGARQISGPVPLVVLGAIPPQPFRGAHQREPGIDTPQPLLWISGSLAALGPRNDGRVGLTRQNSHASGSSPLARPRPT